MTLWWAQQGFIQAIPLLLLEPEYPSPGFRLEALVAFFYLQLSCYLTVTSFTLMSLSIYKQNGFYTADGLCMDDVFISI